MSVRRWPDRRYEPFIAPFSARNKITGQIITAFSADELIRKIRDAKWATETN